MSTSGTYSFNAQVQDVLTGALELVGAYDPGIAIPTSDQITCTTFLNMILKQWAMKGLPLWLIQDITVPLQSGVAQYNLSQIMGMPLPLRIQDAYLVDNFGNSVTLMVVSRYDWDTLGQKNSQGVPNQLWYNPQLNNGIITLYNVPADNFHTLHVVVKRQTQDAGVATNNLDIPQEAILAITYSLADSISLIYQCPAGTRQELNAKAVALKDEFFDSQQEWASVQFTPSERAM